ncbi:GGDEF domain-containing protein [Immundisolibacter sp.]|uniref:GGDEF domain-containing protein n=1 Tax=Immundisolibacter sp. TaxID=1934948 RepID=UPI0035666DA6
MPTYAASENESILRDAVSRLCALAADTRPALAPALAAITDAVHGDLEGDALRRAFARLDGAGTAAAAPHAQTLRSTTDGRLIQDILKQLTIPAGLEPLANDIKRSLDTPACDVQRRQTSKQLVRLVGESKAHAERRQTELKQFLKHTVTRLLQLEAALNEANTLTQTASSETLQGRRATQAELVQLRTMSAETEDLDQLKAFVGTRLDHLQAHLQQQDNAGDLRQRKLMEQLVALSQQVTQLSAETINLRSRLDVTTEEALRDPLTGAFNRLAYDRRAALEVARWQSDGGALSMIICDIDHFKHINDEFGHAAGDKVLKEVVRLLQQQLRSSDFVGRYGGEEFVVLLNGAGEQAAIQIADKLRRSVKAAPFRSRGGRVPVTISCGIGSFTGDDTLEDVFERTDAALYAAKEQGRDRCVFAAPKGSA